MQVFASDSLLPDNATHRLLNALVENPSPCHEMRTVGSSSAWKHSCQMNPRLCTNCAVKSCDSAAKNSGLCRGACRCVWPI